MTASLAARVIRFVTGSFVQRIDRSNADIPKMRTRWQVGAHLLLPVVGISIARSVTGGIDCDLLLPENARPGKVLLYLHGGAFAMGSPETHRQLVGHIARAGRVRALVPDYRLAPEHRFPAAIDDAVAVYRGLIADGTQPGDIILAGDSAGGCLAVALMLALRDAGDPLPDSAVLLSPLADLTGSGDSMRTRASLDPWFRPGDIAVVAGHYCEPGQETLPLVSPVFADCSGLPPLYIQVGDHEILLSDAERLAERQRAAGGEATLEIFPEMWHVFQVCTMKMPESRLAIRKIGAFIDSRCG